MLEFSIFGVFLQRFSPELISWQAAITPTLNSQLQLTLDFYDLPKIVKISLNRLNREMGT